MSGAESIAKMMAHQIEHPNEVAHEYEGLPWRESQPLTAKTEAEPYPLEALPDTIREAVREVQAFVKAPTALVASTALAALSLACQAHINVERATNLAGPSGLFLLTIGDSGERKSSCDNYFMDPVRSFEKGQIEAAKPEIKRYKGEMAAWETKCSGVKERLKQAVKSGKPTEADEYALQELEAEKPEPPRIPKLLYTDATQEALVHSLAIKWPCGGIVSDEAGTVFGGHAMGRDSVMRNLAALNTLWDGKEMTVDRRSTESFTARNVRLTVGLMVQETTLREFFAKSGALARGSGFLARFLVAWPTSTIGYRPFTEAPAHWPHLARFQQRLKAILEMPLPVDEHNGLTPSMLTMAPEAKKEWVRYHDTIESEMAGGGSLEDLRDVAAKSADNAVRLAALFHLFSGKSGQIDLQTFLGASQVALWHLNESKRFFGEIALPKEIADSIRLDAWLIEYCQRERADRVNKRQVLQYGPIRNDAALLEAIRHLNELDRVRLRTEGKRKIIHLNPDLLDFATATPATPATDGRNDRATVATVATVAVANRGNL